MTEKHALQKVEFEQKIIGVVLILSAGGGAEI